MPIYVATGATYVVDALVLSPAGTGLTGAASTLKIWVRRASDGKFLDFADNTFKSSGWTTRQQAMTEADATNAPGLYTYAFNTGTIVSPSANDTYQIELDQVGANTAANVPQFEDLLMGRHLDTIATNLNATVSSRAVPGDLMGLTAGAITSAKFAADAIDANALAASAASEIAASTWSTSVPDAFLSGSAGFVLGTNLNATVSSRAVPGDAMTLTSGERAAVGTAVWVSSTRTLTAGAITSSTFAADAIDSNAVAASAASEVGTAVWATGTRTVTGTTSGALTSSSFATNAVDANAFSQNAADKAWTSATRTLSAGAITSSTFSADAIDSNAFATSAAVEVAGKVWDELTASHVGAGSFGLLLGVNLDAAVSSRATDAGAASSVWSTLVPGAFGAGSAGFALGTNLDATVSSRSTLTQAQIVSDATPFLGSRIDAAISSRSAPGDAMTLTVGERTAVGTAVWASATRTLTTGAITTATFSTDAIDSNALAASAAVEVAGKVWDELVASHSLTGSFGLLIGTDLDAAVSSRATAADAATAVWSTPVPGAFAGGTAGFNLDVPVSSRLAAAGYTAPLTATQTENAVWDGLTAVHSVVGSFGLLIETDLDAAVSSRATAAGVWGEAVPGAYAVGSAGYALGFNLDAQVSSRSTLTALGVWSELLPGAYGAGQAGFNLDAQVTSRATDSGASAAVWGAAVRSLTSVVLDPGSLTAAAIGAGYVAAVQSGLATSAQVPGLVWDEPLASHTTPGSAGKVLSDIASTGSPAAVAAAVWATPEGAGTMGASLALLRRRTTNRRRVDSGGTVTFYDDAGAPERSATLTDVNGGPIVVVPGDPADSTAEV